MIMLELSKVFVVIYAFLIFYLAFGTFNYYEYGKVNNGQDFLFHFNYANGTKLHDYKDGYNTFFQYFGFNEFVFYAVNVFLIVVLIPLFLFLVAKNFWVVLVYFFGISLPHMMLYGATYPQALIILIFLIYLWKRPNFMLLMICGGLFYLIHSKGEYLFLALLVFEMLAPYLQKRFFAGVVVMQQSLLNNFKDFLNIIFTHIPIPTIWFSLKELKANAFYLLMTVFSFIGAIIIDYRSISIAQIIMCICAGNQIQKTDKKYYKWIAVWFLIQIAIYSYCFVIPTWQMIVSK